MSFRDCSTTSVPRVNANSIGSPRSATEQASSSFQIAVESVSLALARHGAVVLKLRHEDAACLQALQDAASAHLAAQQHPLTPVADGIHMVLPGCSSLDYRPGNSKHAALPDGIRAAAHQVLTWLYHGSPVPPQTAASLTCSTAPARAAIRADAAETSTS